MTQKTTSNSDFMPRKELEQIFTSIQERFINIDNRFDTMDNRFDEQDKTILQHTEILNQHTEMLQRIESLVYLTLEIARHNDVRLKEMATKLRSY